MAKKEFCLGISPITDRVYAGTAVNGIFSTDKKDVTVSFKRCIVNYCSESVEFEVDGMKFKATCERID